MYAHVAASQRAAHALQKKKYVGHNGEDMEQSGEEDGVGRSRIHVEGDKRIRMEVEDAVHREPKREVLVQVGNGSSAFHQVGNGSYGD